MVRSPNSAQPPAAVVALAEDGPEILTFRPLTPVPAALVADTASVPWVGSSQPTVGVRTPLTVTGV